MEDRVKIRQRPNIFGKIIELMSDADYINIPFPAHSIKPFNVRIIFPKTLELIQDDQRPTLLVGQIPGQLTKGINVRLLEIPLDVDPIRRQASEGSLIIQDQDAASPRQASRPPRQGRFSRPPSADYRLKHFSQPFQPWPFL